MRTYKEIVKNYILIYMKINTYFFEKFCDNIFVINNSHKIKKQIKL